MVRSRSAVAAFFVFIGVTVAGLGAAVPVGAAVTSCTDGRGWTTDIRSDGTCQHLNACVPTVDLVTAGADLVWRWQFPDRCELSSINAISVLIEHQVATAASGDLSTGTTTRLDAVGHPSPPRRGSGAVAATCGRADLDFVVIAGHEIVATATGTVTGLPCVAVGSPTDPQGPAVAPLLGRWDGSSGAVGSVSRLYWAVFGRQPDDAGFAYWMARLTGGLSRSDAARTWSSLPEWQGAYQGTNNSTFLQRIYGNVLGRTPDDGGLAYWLDRLDGGLTRSDLVLLFSDTPEFRRRTNTQ